MRVFRLCGHPSGSRRRRCLSRRCTIAKAQVLRGERAGLTVAERHRDLVEASAIDGSQLRDARLEYRRVALVQAQVPLQLKVRIHHISWPLRESAQHECELGRRRRVVVGGPCVQRGNVSLHLCQPVVFGGLVIIFGAGLRIWSPPVFGAVEDLVREAAHQPAPRVAREHEQPPIAVGPRHQGLKISAGFPCCSGRRSNRPNHLELREIVRVVEAVDDFDAGIVAERLRFRR